LRRTVFSLASLAAGLGACAASSASLAERGGSAHDVTFLDLQGRMQTLRAYAGKVVVVQVFTTWDMGGLRSVPELNNLQKQRKNTVQVVGVGMDLEGALALRPYINTFHPEYPIWAPDEAFMQGRTLFGLQKEVPRFYIVGRDGTVRGGYVGYVPYADLLRMVDVEAARR